MTETLTLTMTSSYSDHLLGHSDSYFFLASPEPEDSSLMTKPAGWNFDPHQALLAKQTPSTSSDNVKDQGLMESLIAVSTPTPHSEIAEDESQIDVHSKAALANDKQPTTPEKAATTTTDAIIPTSQKHSQPLQDAQSAHLQSSTSAVASKKSNDVTDSSTPKSPNSTLLTELDHDESQPSNGADKEHDEVDASTYVESMDSNEDITEASNQMGAESISSEAPRDGRTGPSGTSSSDRIIDSGTKLESGLAKTASCVSKGRAVQEQL